MMVELEKISIIIPVFNSEKTIKSCIESLINVGYSKNKLEIIFVDDGSTDKTKNLIKTYIDVKLIEQNHRGPATARNNGVRNSSGSIIFFTDSDCIVPKNWIEKMLKNFDENIAIVGGSRVPFSLKTISERFEQIRLEKLYGTKKRFMMALPSGNMAIKREVFELVKGFDEDFKYPSFEDYDLCYRIGDFGYTILYDPKIEIIHFHSSTWKGVLKRAFIYGREEIKFRQKRKYSTVKEFLSPFKFFLSPINAIKNYSFNFMLISIAYDFVNMVGKLSGIIRYRF